MASPRPGRRRQRTLWVLAAFAAFIAFVVYGSLTVPAFRCDVCMSFAGHSMCRSVEGRSESEARSSAINNACALLASGVTDTMACERGRPLREDCQPIP